MALYCHLLLSALCNALFCCHLLTVVQPFGNLKSSHVHPGVSIPPETMMHFPPCFRFSPLFSKTFQTLREIFTILPFPKKFSSFSYPPKFSDDLFFSHRPQISNFPPIFLFQYISPLFRQNYYFPPTLTNFAPCFRQFHLLFTYFTCISFPPYFDHDAFMHHTMHVLDAPGSHDWWSA